MTNRYQQESIRRKRFYLGLILVLFAVNTFLWRGVEWFDSRAFAWTVTEQANRLGVREQNLGEVELTGSAVRLTLWGSRGLVVCSLWIAAEEKKKKHEWNQLELIVGSLIKLQPHFSSIWQFQSHNLAYNVSAELEEGRDQYHFIVRGFQVLYEGGQRLKDNPDLRFLMGFYYQQKLGIADDKNLLQALFQLSCIDPRERDPERLRGPDGQVNQQAFEQFCRKHPHLVRRLRERLNRQTPADVIQFLADNHKIPTRYEESPGPGLSRLKPPDQQFPLLPPERFQADEPTPDDPLGDEFDIYHAAKVWYGYAQLTVAPPKAEPGPRYGDPKQTQYRRPRSPPLLSFRGYPCIAQTFLADKLQKDGWFDGEGWDVDEGQGAQTQWFPGQKVLLGAGRNWSADAWRKAYEMWLLHGRTNGLLVEPALLKQWEDEAAAYRQAFRVEADQLGPDLEERQRAGGMGASFDAHRRLWWYTDNRRLTNYPRFLNEAAVRMTPEAIQARKHFFRAEQLNRPRVAGRKREPALALREYEQGFQLWKDILVKSRDYSREMLIQEEAVELQIPYRALVQEVRELELKQLLVVQDFLTQAAAGTPYLPSVQLLPARIGDFRIVPVPIVAGPLDNLRDERGERVISEEAIRSVYNR